MNRRLSLLALGCLLFATASFGQYAPSDSQTLQALLSEVRQLRQELRQELRTTAQRKEFERRLSELKTRLELLEGDEQRDQSQEIDAEQQLRAEETRLSNLRDQLDRLDKTLENAGRSADGTVQ